MMKRVMYCIAFIFFVNGLFAQVTSSLILSSDTLLIGDPFELQVKLKLPPQYTDLTLDFSPYDTIINLTLPDTIDLRADIEFTGQNWEANPKRLGITLNEENLKTGIWKETFPLRFWDIGVFVLPHPIIITNTGDTLKNVMQLQRPTVHVLPPAGMSPIDTTQIILDIKSIVTEPKTWRDYIGYMLAFIALIALAIFFWWSRKWKLEGTGEQIIETPEVIIPAHINALNKLDNLRKAAIWKTGDIKEYQSRLTFIIREYLENRYDIQALESTTGEIVNKLNHADFDKEYTPALKEILQIADMIKFAKANPPDDIHERFLNSAEDFVVNTKQEIIANELDE